MRKDNTYWSTQRVRSICKCGLILDSWTVLTRVLNGLDIRRVQQEDSVDNCFFSHTGWRVFTNMGSRGSRLGGQLFSLRQVEEFSPAPDAPVSVFQQERFPRKYFWQLYKIQNLTFLWSKVKLDVVQINLDNLTSSSRTSTKLCSRVRPIIASRTTTTWNF